MKNFTQNAIRFTSAILSLVLTMVLAAKVNATVLYWDNNGSSTPSSGTWNTSSTLFSTSSALTSSLVAWNTADAVCFCAGSATPSGNVVITVTSGITFGGFFNGSLTPPGCNLILTNGGVSAGVLTIPSGLNAAADTGGSDGDPTIIALQLAGAGALSVEGGDSLYLNASNSYTGGTLLGYAGNAFTAALNFNNSNAFGTGSITVSNTGGVNGALAVEGSAALTVTNAFKYLQSTGGLDIVGNAAGLTLSGPWTLTSSATLGSSGTGNLVILSGVMSGAGGLFTSVATTPGIMRLSGANTYSGNTTISNISLQLGVAGGIPSGSGKGNVFITNTGILDVHGVSGAINGLFGNGTIDDTTGTGTLSIGNNNQSAFFTGVVQNTGGTLNITKAGTGTLVLSNNNTYSGSTTVSAGTLIVGQGGAVPNTSALTVSIGALLDLDHNNNTFATLSGGGNVANNDGGLIVQANFSTNSTLATYSCFSGTITNGSLTKSGTHSMALRGSNTFFSSSTTLNAGTLSVGAAPNRLPVDNTVNQSGGIFQLDANSQTINTFNCSSGAINLGSGQLILTGSSSSISGVIEDAEISGVPLDSGHGLRGYYYTNQDMSGLGLVRDDTNINFSDFTSASQNPFYPKTNNISIRWLGQILTTAAGTYTFTIPSDDGSRLWVNGTLVEENWVTQGGTARSGSIVLAANTRYDIVVEYFNQTGGASCKLFWAAPGDTVSNIVAPDYLFLPAPGKLISANGGSVSLNGSNTWSGGSIVTAGSSMYVESVGGLGNGSVTVSNGYLELDTTGGNGIGCIATTGDLLLSGTSPSVNLNYFGTNIIHGLSYNGGVTYQPAGVYGAPGSGATYTSSLFSASSSQAYLLVTAAPSTNILTSSAGTVAYGTSITFTSTITGSGATPTGTVTFYDGGVAIGNAPLVGGVAMLTISDLQVATSPHSITAIYSGDANNSASTSAAISETINQAFVSVPTFSAVVSNKVYDATLTASLGTVSYTLSGVLPGDSNNVHLVLGPSFQSKNVGTNVAVNISYALAGSLSTNYVLTQTGTFTTGTITSKPLIVTNVSASNKPYDGTTTATVNASGATISSGVIAGDNVTLITTGATGAFASSAVGTNITVTVNGLTLGGSDGGNYIVTPPTTTANITKGVSSIAINPSANPASLGANVSFTANVTGLGVTPTGSVTFQTNSVMLGTLNLASGSATTNTSNLPTGTNLVTVTYTGDANYSGATNSINEVIGVTRPTLSITATGTGSVILSWSGTHTLQSAPVVLSTNTAWTNVPGSPTSPYTNTSANTAQFFRLKN